MSDTTPYYRDYTMTYPASNFYDHVHFEGVLQTSHSVVIYYYVTDSLGTPWRMVDASGTVVWAATYSAFGEATTIPALTTVDQPLRMPGQYFDAESKLHYNLARYYDPSIGRYLSVDPLRDAEDYGYAAGNPLKYSDPTGTILQIAGTAQYVLDTMRALSELDNGVELGSDGKTVQLSQASCASMQSYGSSLLASLIASDKVFRIMSYDDFRFNVTTASKHRRGNLFSVYEQYGVDGLISFEPNRIARVDTYMPEGNIQEQSRPPFIGLAHELVHANNFLLGIRESDLDKNEALAIGTGGTAPISENDVRGEHHLLLRAR